MTLNKFHRFIPTKGIKIFPDILYVDINDISEEKKFFYKNFFESDKDYEPLAKKGREIPHGSNIDRKYCSYVFKKDSLIGIILFFEYLDNPDGYGKDDFRYTKLIMPEYRKTKYSRYAGSDMIHMILVSGIAKRLYTYSVENKKTGTYIERIDLNAPCMGKVYPTDGPVQQYMLISKEIKTVYGNYVILEFNGDIYNSMNLKKYFLTVPGRTEQLAEKWIKQMNHAAELMKNTVEGK